MGGREGEEVGKISDNVIVIYRLFNIKKGLFRATPDFLWK
jgi:hypothetical protein